MLCFAFIYLFHELNKTDFEYSTDIYNVMFEEKCGLRCKMISLNLLSPQIDKYFTILFVSSHVS